MSDFSFQDLIKVARSDRPEDRNLLAEALNKMVLASGKHLSSAEIDLVFDILRRLIHEVEIDVRRHLAENLADRGDVPHDLVVTLANDIIEVAFPILSRSKVLEDVDLIQLILDHATQHQLAISGRKTVSEDVSATLADTGNAEVIEALLKNPGAAFSSETLEKLVEDSMHMPTIQEPLVRRSDLPPDLTRRMYEWVGEAVKSYIDVKLGDDLRSSSTASSALDEEVKHAVTEALEDDEMMGGSTAPNFEVPGVGGNFRVHPRVMVRTLEEGDVFHFEELFRDFTGLPESAATRVLYDTGPEALAIACKGSGIDRYSFSDMVCLLHGDGNAQGFRDTPAFMKAMDYFERIDGAGAKRVLQAWSHAG